MPIEININLKSSMIDSTVTRLVKGLEGDRPAEHLISLSRHLRDSLIVGVRHVSTSS